ncbi:spore coat protein GerQ [Neobacillus niacini]|uniref:spore coat protein GerQ n=1 Tax=Neobacillus niacini TaxID=86668 RepID=UPI0007ABF734|nr:spore coat protein GerQ [Neobacillus niacini]MEC1522005.1 spore coat protein GerQ [Neobacillus niacini]
MSQYYNQQGYQPYPARQQAGNQFQGQGQGFFPGTQQQGFPQFPPASAPQSPPGTVQPQGMLPLEQSYIENILRLNKGKLATVYATFEGNSQWNGKKFVGIIEAAGRDHLILSDPQTGQRTLIPMVAFDYATFDEELEYEYPFGGSPGLSTFPPR